jgi:hypothetical protein
MISIWEYGIILCARWPNICIAQQQYTLSEITENEARIEDAFVEFAEKKYEQKLRASIK